MNNGRSLHLRLWLGWDDPARAAAARRGARPWRVGARQRRSARGRSPPRMRAGRADDLARMANREPSTRSPRSSTSTCRKTPTSPSDHVRRQQPLQPDAGSGAQCRRGSGRLDGRQRPWAAGRHHRGRARPGPDAVLLRARLERDHPRGDRQLHLVRREAVGGRRQRRDDTLFYNKDDLRRERPGGSGHLGRLDGGLRHVAQAGFAMPIGLGGADKYPISWWQSLLWGRFAGPEGVDNVMFGDGRWDEEPFVQATAKLKELNDAGCFGPNPLAEIQDDVEARFWRGEIPMVFTGPWIIGPGIACRSATRSRSSASSRCRRRSKATPIYPTEDIGTGWYINATVRAPGRRRRSAQFHVLPGGEPPEAARERRQRAGRRAQSGRSSSCRRSCRRSSL